MEVDTDDLQKQIKNRFENEYKKSTCQFLKTRIRKLARLAFWMRLTNWAKTSLFSFTSPSLPPHIAVDECLISFSKSEI